ncbi:hypothetical protein SKAU_G00277260 [Synaphobranchus kaupii]|uniref:Uncharacterized protein n=1 Tax=Synaphobranchus kaupii TaxID=118154 RepID=A0A9Q1F1H6_SYNKA|nr:hypothetical protein SKAU_G00277260 [Synaphobranchus kaupii]
MEHQLNLDFGDSPISEEFKQHITERIWSETKNAFSYHDLDIGHAPGVTHKIVLTDETPFKERTRRVSPADFDDLRNHLQELMVLPAFCEEVFQSCKAIERSTEGRILYSDENTGQRWLSALSIYDFEISYRAGRTNIDADGLSRRPHGPVIDDEDSQKYEERVARLISRTREVAECDTLPSEVWEAACLRHGVRSLNEGEEESGSEEDEVEPCSAVETLLCKDSAIPDGFESPELWPGQPALPGLTLDDWVNFQQEDITLGRVIKLVKNGQRLDEQKRRKEPLEVRRFLREWPKLVLHGNVLHRRVLRNEEGDRVLIRNVNLRGKHKLANRWEPRVHIVIRQVGEDLPVYVVRPEDDDNGAERTLHRDLLRPCGFISCLIDEEEAALEQPRRMRTRISAQEEINRSEVEQDAEMDLPGGVEEEDVLGVRCVLNPEAQEFTYLTESESSPHSSPTPEGASMESPEGAVEGAMVEIDQGTSTIRDVNGHF